MVSPSVSFSRALGAFGGQIGTVYSGPGVGLREVSPDRYWETLFWLFSSMWMKVESAYF